MTNKEREKKLKKVRRNIGSLNELLEEILPDYDREINQREIDRHYCEEGRYPAIEAAEAIKRALNREQSLESCLLYKTYGGRV